MESRRNLLLCVTVVLMPFLLYNSPTFAAEEAKPAKKAAKPAPKPDASYKAVNEFCKQRSTSDDRSFCSKVFKANPQSAQAKDTPALLKIAIELAVGNAKKTRGFLSALSLKKETKLPLKPVLQECISAYDIFIKQIRYILGDLEDDPPMASYDARVAKISLNRCQYSLSTSKVADPSIANRHKIASQYGRLVEEIANNV